MTSGIEEEHRGDAGKPTSLGEATMKRIVAALCVTGLLAPNAEASDFYDNPYLLRLPLALARASNYAETAGRQASIAYPGGSSVNPAADAAKPLSRSSVTATTIQAFGDGDAHIGAYIANVGVPLDDKGVVSLAYAYTDTYDGATKAGLDNLLRSDELFLGFAHRLTPSTPIGVQFRYVNSTIHDETIVFAGLPIATRSKADMQSGDLSVGVQTAIADDLRLGAIAGFGYGEGTIRVTNLTPIPIPPPFGPIPSGTRLTRFDDSVRTYVAGVGAAYLPSASSIVLADLTYVAVDSNEGGGANLTRLALGGETRLNDAWALRAGWSYDSADQATYSVGLGARLAQGLRLDVAYQYNATPEIEPEFGKMNIVSASLALEL